MSPQGQGFQILAFVGTTHTAIRFSHNRKQGVVIQSILLSN